jgi:hypothetical protein
MESNLRRLGKTCESASSRAGIRGEIEEIVCVLMRRSGFEMFVQR